MHTNNNDSENYSCKNENFWNLGNTTAQFDTQNNQTFLNEAVTNRGLKEKVTRNYRMPESAKKKDIIRD